jgi:hypothetical protein
MVSSIFINNLLTRNIIDTDNHTVKEMQLLFGLDLQLITAATTPMLQSTPECWFLYQGFGHSNDKTDVIRVTK